MYLTDVNDSDHLNSEDDEDDDGGSGNSAQLMIMLFKIIYIVMFEWLVIIHLHYMNLKMNC